MCIRCRRILKRLLITLSAMLLTGQTMTQENSADGAPDGMVLVTAGTFQMGSDDAHIARMIIDCRKERQAGEACEDWLSAELPRHQVHLDAFYIDVYEVTNADFERFVGETGYRTIAEETGVGLGRPQGQWAPVPGANWRAPNGPGSVSQPDHPVVQISWSEARAYCQWAGKRLPTEAEWEKAARGTDGRLYPWGSVWDPTKANAEKRIGTTKPVGSYPEGVGPYGTYDMAGNVWEWVEDWYDKDYYQRSPTDNPRGPETGETRILRGGSWHHSPIIVRSTYRIHIKPDLRGDLMGVRCARSAAVQGDLPLSPSEPPDDLSR